MNRILLSIATLVATLPSTTVAELQIIGTGYGRTGTDTLRTALTELGYKTYHMKEIIFGTLRRDVIDWKILAETNCKDTDLLKGIFERDQWDAAVDFPAVLCWEQLIEIYPNAKIIHTERTSPEKWYESASSSILIGRTLFPFNIFNKLFPFWRDHRKMVNALWSRVAGKDIFEMAEGWPDVYKKELVAGYIANNAKVRKIVPVERLLIQDHSKGWELLVRFLGKDVPDVPYPHSNTREEFMGVIKKVSRRMSAVVFAFVVAVFVLVQLLIGMRSGKKNKRD
jgi:hypothetical protein